MSTSNDNDNLIRHSVKHETAVVTQLLSPTEKLHYAYVKKWKYKQNPKYTVLKEIVGLMWTSNDSLWCPHNVAYDAAVLVMYENITPKAKCRELLYGLTWLKRSEERSYLTK